MANEDCYSRGYLFLCALPLCAQLEQDKVKHFAAGTLSGAIGADIADGFSGGNRYWRIAGAVTSSLLAGLAKEAYDEHKYGGGTIGILLLQYWEECLLELL